MNKKTIQIIVIVILVGGLSFYGGSKYSQSKQTASASGRGAGQGNFGGGNRFLRGGPGANFTGGQVISVDKTSMTVQARDGNSKIVFFTTATPVMKMVAGANSDIVAGKEVTITGTPNPDGSISAESIQIRPLPVQTGQAATSTN